MKARMSSRGAFGAVLRRAFTKEAAWRLGATLGCVLVASALSAFAPVALQRLVDVLATVGGAGGLEVSLGPQPLFLLALYVGALAAARMVREVQRWFFGLAEQTAIKRLSDAAFAHALRLPLSHHVGSQTGALNQTIEQGIQGARLALQHMVFIILPGVFEITLIVGVVLSFFSWPILVVFLASLVAYIVIFLRGAAQTLRASRHVSNAKIAAGGELTDALLNIETLKLFTGESVAERRYGRRTNRLRTAWRAFHAVRISNGALATGVFTAALATTLYLAAQRVETGGLTVGAFVLLHTYLLQIIRPLEALGFALRDLGQGLAYTEKLGELLARPTETPASTTTSTASGPPPRQAPERAPAPARLTFENVWFAYADGAPVLRGLSFDVEPGRMTAIVGASGSGKSSIARLVARLYDPDHGRILVDGEDVRDYSLEEARRMVALVPQDTSLFNGSLRENIALAAPEAPIAAVAAAARAAQLGPVLQRAPGGLAWRVGERGLRLSGGERQRVAIARAILRGARILVFDEATSALDSRTEAAVMGSLEDLASGATTLVIAHRLATIARADHILVIEAGRVAEAGGHTDLLRRDGLYARLWRAQSESRAVA